MSNHTSGAWRYFRNSAGNYSIFPVEVPDLQAVPLAEVFPQGISDPEANARLIAASPELFTALVWVVEALRGTEIFMAGQGLDTKELDEIVRSAGELLERIDGE